jgi:hypothetical protein
MYIHIFIHTYIYIYILYIYAYIYVCHIVDTTMNGSVFWDNLDPAYSGSSLACAPQGGDPAYAFVCAYTNQFTATAYILNGLCFLHNAHLEASKYHSIGGRFRGTVAQQPLTTTPKAQEKNLQDATKNQKDSDRGWMLQRLIRRTNALPPRAHIALVVGISTVATGLSTIVGGTGTSYSHRELRGAICDGFGEWSCIYYAIHIHS